MYEKDYILRIATQATRAIARILGLKQAGQYQQALSQIDQTLQEFLGLSATLAAQLSASELIMICRFGGVLDKDKALLLAALLKEEGDIYAAENQSIESHNRYTKSLNIALEALIDADPALGREYLPLIEGLTIKLGESEINPDLRYDLSRYYDQIGDPATARSYFRGW